MDNKKIYCVFASYSSTGDESLIEIYDNKEEAEKHADFLRKNKEDRMMINIFCEEWNINNKFNEEEWNDEPIRIAHLD